MAVAKHPDVTKDPGAPDAPIAAPGAAGDAPSPFQVLPRPRRARQSHRSRVSAAFYRDVVGSMRNGVVVITNRGVLAHINREAYRILGIAPGADDIGSRYVQVLRGCPEIVPILRSAFELSNPPNRAELRLHATNRVIGYTVCPVRDDAGQVTGSALLFKDLTRVEQLEERERLRDRLAALGEMAAAIAHEVKNPLAGIKVMAGLLKRRVAGVPDAENLLNDIIHEAKMADAIVLEILEFVRPIRLQMDAISLGRVVDEALRLAESHVDRGGVTVTVDISPDLPPIDADGNQLRQLFTNLFANAFEALDHKGSLTVQARVRASEIDPDTIECRYLPPTVLVTIGDDGPGIPEELRDRVFSPFFTTKARGSGLGLAIVRKIVDAHDGRIDMEVGEHGGTTFRVTLPLVATRELASPFANDSMLATGT